LYLLYPKGKRKKRRKRRKRRQSSLRRNPSRRLLPRQKSLQKKLNLSSMRIPLFAISVSRSDINLIHALKRRLRMILFIA